MKVQFIVQSDKANHSCEISYLYVIQVKGVLRTSILCAIDHELSQPAVGTIVDNFLHLTHFNCSDWPYNRLFLKYMCTYSWA